MTHRQTHFLEKLEFQVAAIAGAAVVYWFVWPLLIPGDPELPICFLAGGQGAHLFALIGFACALGIACGAITVTARPQTAVLALALGIGGLSLRSPRIRSLLWAQQDSMHTLYWRMALEVLVLLAVIVIAGALAGIGRRLAAALAGGLLWRDPLLQLDDERRAAYKRELARRDAEKPSPWSAWMVLSLLSLPLGVIWVPKLNVKDEKLLGRDTAVRGVLGFMISLTASAIVVFMLLRSPERGQILFALFAGCFLGVFIGQKVVPTRMNLTAWAVPVALGAALYVLAAISAVRTGQGAWIEVRLYAQALPIDWMTAGLGGAMLGHWEDLRMREARYIEDSLNTLQTEGGN
jgi:hypothetical protein